MPKRISIFAVLCFVLVAAVFAQESRDGNLAERQKAPTVLGGTGLFNTFSTRTLCKGEFNFALFWNNYDRDPGDIDINQVPFNISLGLTNRWELWVNWVTWQNTTSRQPFLLSGYQLSATRFYGDPFTLLGPPVGGKDAAAAFFPGGGAIFGGILPALGRFGTPNNFPNSFFSPGGPGATQARGLGPLIKTDLPSFYPELPFFGEIDFVGFDSLGRPVFGPRQSSNGSGDVTIGTKLNLIDANQHWFSMALGGYLKIPVSSSDSARARGRTSGEYEFGPILMFGQESNGKRLRVYENVGYIHTTDPSDNDVKLLDLPDKLLLNGGVSVALNSHAEFVGELLHTHFVGSDTPSLIENNPTDLNLGMRFFFKNGAISFGGAYRRFLNNEDDITLPVLRARLLLIPPFFVPDLTPEPRDQNFASGGANGFAGYFSIGGRRRCPPPPAPTCVVTPSATSVNRGERLMLTTTPATPGYGQGQVTYDYRWEVKDAQGRMVTVSGSGPSVEVPTSGLACGRYSATTNVTASVQAVDCPSDCAVTGQTSCTTSFEITDQPCPTVSCQITASPSGSVKAGDRVTLTATSTGADNPTYTWSTSHGRLSSTTGSSVTLDTTGVAENTRIIVSAEVNTSRTSCDQPCSGNKCSVEIPICPTITCEITREPADSVQPGTIVTLTVSSTGTGNPKYNWSKNTEDGRLYPLTGSSVKFDTTGVNHDVTITVSATSDTSCAGGQCEITIPIGTKPPCNVPFELDKSGVNNIAKACLADDVTLKLLQEGRYGVVVVDGHQYSKEPAGTSQARAKKVCEYLVNDQGIDPSRILIRDFKDTCLAVQKEPDLKEKLMAMYRRKIAASKDSKRRAKYRAMLNAPDIVEWNINPRVEVWVISDSSKTSKIEDSKECTNGKPLDIKPKPCREERPRKHVSQEVKKSKKSQ